MKANAIKLAVASVLAVGAVSQANAAFFEPWTVTGAETYTLRVGGATAQDQGMVLLMRRMCSNGTMTRVSGNNVTAIMCEANGVDSAPIALGTKMVFYKNSTGGSGNGVKPVSNYTVLPFANLASLTEAQYTTPATCVLTTVGSTADFADYKNYACGLNLGNSSLQPDAGISDVEPGLLGWVDGVDGTIDIFAGAQVIFGMPVSKNFRDALQAAQGKTVGSGAESEMPSLTKGQIASIFNGGLLPVVRLSDNTGTQLAAPAGSATISICRRKAGSGTLASYNAYFLNTPCAKGMKEMVGGVDGNALIAGGLPGSVANRVNEYGATPQVIGCLNANHAVNKYAIGQASMENVVGSSYSGTGLAAPFDADTGNWGYVKVQGYSPTLLNVVQGKYDFMYEATYQHRKVGNTFGPALAGDPKTLFDRVVATNGSFAVIKELNNAFVQTFGTSGLLGKPGSPTAPSAAPAGVLTAAEVIANPVNTWTRAATGTPNSCQPAYLTRETGLDMLQ